MNGRTSEEPHFYPEHPYNPSSSNTPLLSPSNTPQPPRGEGGTHDPSAPTSSGVPKARARCADPGPRSNPYEPENSKKRILNNIRTDTRPGYHMYTFGRTSSEEYKMFSKY